MKVNDKKFDKVIHDPVRLAREFKKWEDEALNITKRLSIHLDKGNKFLAKFALMRQNMLNSVELEESVKARKGMYD